MSMSSIRGKKFYRALAAVAAGTSDQKSQGIDCAGFDVVAFALLLGTITSTATLTVKLQGSDTDVDGDFVDLENTGLDIADSESGLVAILECVRPQYRYIRLYIDRGTANTVIDGVLAWTDTFARVQPVEQDDTEVTHYAFESFVSPEAGTA